MGCFRAGPVTWVVDPPVRVGTAAFAAVSRVESVHHCAGTTAIVTAEKNPVLILAFHNGEVAGAGIDGVSYIAMDIERKFPQAIACTLARLERVPRGQ